MLHSLLALSVLGFAVPADLGFGEEFLDSLRLPSRTLAQEEVEMEAAKGYRFLQRFPQDAAVVDFFWLEAQARGQIFRDGPDKEVVILQPTAALGIGGTIELGAVARILEVESDFKPFDDEFGLGDADLWGKIRILRDPLPLDLSVGALLKLPLGDEDDGLGTGNADLELFGALRKAIGPFEVSGSAGVRYNGDDEAVPASGTRDGKPSGLFGVGAALWVNDHWAVAAELTGETRRFERGERDLRFTPQTELRATDSLRLRAGVGFGLEDASPEVEGIVSLSLVF